MPFLLTLPNALLTLPVHLPHPPVTREVAKEAATPTPGVKVNPIAQEPLNFLLHVEGPAEMVAPGETKAVPSPYAGKIFEVLVKCPADYPHKAPTVRALRTCAPAPLAAACCPAPCQAHCSLSPHAHLCYAPTCRRWPSSWAPLARAPCSTPL